MLSRKKVYSDPSVTKYHVGKSWKYLKINFQFYEYIFVIFYIQNVPRQIHRKIKSRATYSEITVINLAS